MLALFAFALITRIQAADLTRSYYGPTTDRVIQVDFTCAIREPRPNAAELASCAAHVRISTASGPARPHEVIKMRSNTGRAALYLDLATGHRLTLMFDRGGGSRVRLQSPELLSLLYTRIATAGVPTEIWAMEHRLDLLCEGTGEFFTPLEKP